MPRHSQHYDAIGVSDGKSNTQIPSMNVTLCEQVLRITGCRDLSDSTATVLLAAVRPALDQCSIVEIDLSDIATMDCRGLGTLVSVRNVVRDRARRLCVVNPSVAVERVFHATRTTPLFEIERPDNRAPPRSADEPSHSSTKGAAE